MKTSRQRLLEYIQSHRLVTATDLSHALRMTQANARYHLEVLQEQGLVEVVGQRPPRSRGRPSNLYSLSEQALGDNLDRLASALLAEAARVPEGAGGQDFLERVAQRVLLSTGRGFTSESPVLKETKGSGRGMTLRLAGAVQQLNELHYQSRWEAHAEGPQIRLGHCPYAAILADHPELCRLDASLLEQMLGTPVSQEAKLASDRSGAIYCLFSVGKKDPALPDRAADSARPG